MVFFAEPGFVLPRHPSSFGLATKWLGFRLVAVLAAALVRLANPPASVLPFLWAVNSGSASWSKYPRASKKGMHAWFCFESATERQRESKERERERARERCDAADLAEEHCRTLEICSLSSRVSVSEIVCRAAQISAFAGQLPNKNSTRLCWQALAHSFGKPLPVFGSSAVLGVFSHKRAQVDPQSHATYIISVWHRRPWSPLGQIVGMLQFGMQRCNQKP